MLVLFGFCPNDRLENLSLEQVLVSTYALSNKMELIRDETVDSILEHFQLTALDRNKVLQACVQAKKVKCVNQEAVALE